MKNSTMIGAICASGFIATAAYAQVEVPPATEEAMRYYWSGNYLYIARIIWSLLVPAALLYFGLAGKIANFAERFGKNTVLFYAVSLPINFVVVMGIIFLADLPLEYYGGYVRQHAYELSNQSLGRWFSVYLIGFLQLAVIGSLVIWIPYLLLRNAPKTWWIWTGILICPFLFLMAMIVPVYLDPMINDFGPMQDKELETDILALAERSNIEGSRVFEVNMSEDTKAVNAYVTGFMNTKRLVLWDTILAKLNRDELLFVMGHEMGHYVLNHVVHGVLLTSALFLIGLFIVHKVSRGILTRFGGRLGFDSLGHPGSLLLLIFLMQIISLVMNPIGNAYSRHVEHESDRFGLELTQLNEAAATAFVTLQAENLGNPYPGPIYVFFRASHPPIGKRIEFMNSYKPWETGEPLK